MGTFKVDGNIISTKGIKVNNTDSSGYVSMFEDGEGGTIQVSSKTGAYLWEMDAYNDIDFRIFTNGSGTYKFFTFHGSSGGMTIPGTFSAGGAIKATGSIHANNNYALRFGNINSDTAYLAADAAGIYLAVYGSGNSGKTVHLETYDTGIYHRKNGTNYEILTTANWSNWCAPVSGSVNYVKVANSSDLGGSGSFTLNDLAKTGFAAGMIQSSVDNPTGSTKWVHALSMCWGEGSNTDWISQLAFGVENSNGLWYRTNVSNCVGKSWKRVLDSSNYSSYALPITGGTLNGNLNVGGKVELWSNGEGGNIRLTSPNGSLWSIDALGNTSMRFIWAESSVPFTFTKDGTINATYFSGTANYANNAGYATTADETNASRGGGSIPWAGSFDSEPDVTAYRSMFSTYMDSSSTWWNLISNRHKNGSSDGVSYGMYIKCRLTGSWAHLLWNRQYGSSWQGERTIHDTGNVCISSSNPGNGSFYGQIWLKI